MKLLIAMLAPAARMLPRAAAQLFRSLRLRRVRIPRELCAQFRSEFGTHPVRQMRAQLSASINRLKTAMRPIAQDLELGEEEVLAVDNLATLEDKQRRLWTDARHPRDHLPVPEFTSLGEDDECECYDHDRESDDLEREIVPVDELDDDTTE
jgi:hypothetical protein